MIMMGVDYRPSEEMLAMFRMLRVNMPDHPLGITVDIVYASQSIHSHCLELQARKLFKARSVFISSQPRSHLRANFNIYWKPQFIKRRGARMLPSDEQCKE